MQQAEQLKQARFDERRIAALIFSRAESIERAGVASIFGGLAIIYFWFGGMKFTSYEANGLVPLVENSPFLSWTYAIFSVQGFSNLLGGLEISIGVLIAARFLSPLASAIGAALSVGLFTTTVSMLLSTPGAFEPSLGFPAISVAPGQFLLKDVGLFAASVFALGNSLQTMAARKENWRLMKGEET